MRKKLMSSEWADDVIFRLGRGSTIHSTSNSTMNWFPSDNAALQFDASYNAPSRFGGEAFEACFTRFGALV
jgi:hypothetical protein